MMLGDLARAMDGRLHPGFESARVGSVIIDSRQASPGSLFFALRGERTDGHEYAANVLQTGGYPVVSRGEWPEGAIIVEDVEEALLKAASWRRGRMQSRVIGISGSSGKTSTRRLLIAALSEEFSVFGTSGNLNNHLGLPLTILSTPEPDPDIVVLEMGMNHPGELTILGKTAMPTDCMVTNIGTAHIEYFDSRDGIAEAKAELIAQTGINGVCVIPVSEPILLREAERKDLTIRFAGPGGDGWVERTDQGHRLMPWGIEMDLLMAGAHNYRNAVSVVLMAEAMGVQASTAVRSMEQVIPLAGRGRRVTAGRVTILDESYNANPESTAACLDALAALEGDRGAVLGDMRELGPAAPGYHRSILKRADLIGLRFLILTGPVYASVSDTVTDTPVILASDWQEALERLLSISPDGCTVLVKGSNSLGLGELVKAMEED